MYQQAAPQGGYYMPQMHPQQNYYSAQNMGPIRAATPRWPQRGPQGGGGE